MSQLMADDCVASAKGDRDSPPQNLPFWRSRHMMGLAVGIASTLLTTTAPAKALEELRLSYLGFQFSTISVSELATFAETGQLSRNLESLLGLIKVDRDTALQMLTYEVPVNGQLLNDVSYTFVGESFFQLIGTAFKLPNSSTPSWPFLRDAVLVSAFDNQVNALEILQAVDAEAVIVDTERVGQVIEEVQKDAATLEAFLDSGFRTTDSASGES